MSISSQYAEFSDIPYDSQSTDVQAAAPDTEQIKTAAVRAPLADSQPVRIGIIGSGYIARGLVLSLNALSDMVVTKVLTRSKIGERTEFSWGELLTNAVDEVIDHAELIVECSGDPIYGTDVLAKALAAGLPVVTMNTELHATTGSYLARRGYITEAEGDQPGCLAALHEDVVQMGFKPLVYGNMKGFLNENPTPEEMTYWAKRQGISVPLVTAFTDGTKVQFEQVLVANGLGADIIQDGLLGIAPASLETGANQLAEYAVARGKAVSDYLLSSQQAKLPPGVFITASHDVEQQEFLQYYKLGAGPFYTLQRDFHLPHLEIAKTIRRVLGGGGVLLNNGTSPTCSMAAIVKRPLSAGTHIQRSIGTFDLRGIAVQIDNNPDHVPLGLLAGARLRRALEPGEQVKFADVDLPDSLALTAWQETLFLRQNQHTASAV